MLLPYSKAVDRDLDALVESGQLRKLAGGLYYKPAMSRLGTLPPKDDNLVSCFLRDKHFLMYSMNQYNSLGVGLTQLYNRVVVLNRKRHGVLKLGNKEFDFRRPSKGFPGKVTPEFLLVDLVNNLADLAEDTSLVKENVRKNLSRFDKSKLIHLAQEYGKISTKKFFEETCHQ
ncbi:MAG: DUF6088 family protein [Candidatus Paceibacterales bacterium]